MEYTRADIIKKLLGLKEAERRKRQIIFEIEHNGGYVSEEDMIDAMNFKTGITKLSVGGQTSDIVPDIAISYAEKAKDMNEQHLKELSEELYKLSIEMARLSYYISLLPGEQSNAITYHYLECLTITQTAKELNISDSSVKNLVSRALKELIRMYSYVKPLI